MSKRLFFWGLVILDTVLLVFVVRYRWLFKGGCVIRLVSESDLLSAQVVDYNKFSRFVKTFIPCQERKFTVGKPGSSADPVEVSQLDVVFDDQKHDHGIAYVSLEEAKKPGRSGKRLASYGFELNENDGRATVYLQFSQEALAKADFEDYLFWFLAGRLEMLANYRRVSPPLESEIKEKLKVDPAGAGLKYEKK